MISFIILPDGRSPGSRAGPSSCELLDMGYGNNTCVRDVSRQASPNWAKRVTMIRPTTWSAWIAPIKLVSRYKMNTFIEKNLMVHVTLNADNPHCIKNKTNYS